MSEGKYKRGSKCNGALTRARVCRSKVGCWCHSLQLPAQLRPLGWAACSAWWRAHAHATPMACSMMPFCACMRFSAWSKMME